MRIPPQILITFSIVFICWCFTEAGWSISQKRELPVQTKGRYSFDLSQRGLPISTCTDCYTVKDKSRLHVRYRNNLYSSDVTSIESLHDAIIVIATVVIATSWITIFSLFLHNYTSVPEALSEQYEFSLNYMDAQANLDPHWS